MGYIYKSRARGGRIISNNSKWKHTWKLPFFGLCLLISQLETGLLKSLQGRLFVTIMHILKDGNVFVWAGSLKEMSSHAFGGIHWWFLAFIHSHSLLGRCQWMHCVRADWPTAACWDMRQAYWHEEQSPCREASCLNLRGLTDMSTETIRLWKTSFQSDCGRSTWGNDC